MRRRVVVTGVGIVSSIGNDLPTVLAALRAGQSGTRAMHDWEPFGIACRVAGKVHDIAAKRAARKIPRAIAAGTTNGAVYGLLAALDAVDDARLGESELRQAGAIIGTSVPSVEAIHTANTMLERGELKQIDPFLAFRCMASSAAAAVSNHLKMHGRSYALSSACATGTHCIGHAFELVRAGSLDVALAGGCEELSGGLAASFHVLRRAMSTRHNATPERAGRPYDRDRDGVVLAEGAAVLVVETLEHAMARGAPIRAEIGGFGANADGYDPIMPRLDGTFASECIRMALDDAELKPGDIDYINTHGTGTVPGDLAEIAAIRSVFARLPPFSSTKSMTGHGMAASGAQEAAFCIGMIEHGFIAPSINIDNLDPAFEGLPVARTLLDRPLRHVLTTSFGFGGTNGALVLSRYDP